jgi:hypothetical protein
MPELWTTLSEFRAGAKEPEPTMRRLAQICDSAAPASRPAAMKQGVWVAATLGIVMVMMHHVAQAIIVRHDKDAQAFLKSASRIFDIIGDTRGMRVKMREGNGPIRKFAMVITMGELRLWLS